MSCITLWFVLFLGGWNSLFGSYTWSLWVWNSSLFWIPKTPLFSRENWSQHIHIVGNPSGWFELHDIDRQKYHTTSWTNNSYICLKTWIIQQHNFKSCLEDLPSLNMWSRRSGGDFNPNTYWDFPGQMVQCMEIRAGNPVPFDRNIQALVCL